MKKSNFVALILGTVGGVFFALGMCMALLPEWGMFQQGIVAGVIGMLVLLVDLVIWRKMEGKEPIKLSGKVVGSIAVGVVGAAAGRWHVPDHGVWKDDPRHRDRTGGNRGASDADSDDGGDPGIERRRLDAAVSA